MIETLKELKRIHDVGIVGGSDLVKVHEQIGDSKIKMKW